MRVLEQHFGSMEMYHGIHQNDMKEVFNFELKFTLTHFSPVFYYFYSPGKLVF